MTIFLGTMVGWSWLGVRDLPRDIIVSSTSREAGAPVEKRRKLVRRTQDMSIERKQHTEVVSGKERGGRHSGRFSRFPGYSNNIKHSEMVTFIMAICKSSQFQQDRELSNARHNAT
jgi:hypothetical protein